MKHLYQIRILHQEDANLAVGIYARFQEFSSCISSLMWTKVTTIKNTYQCKNLILWQS